MTLDEFLLKLRETPRDWRVDDDGLICRTDPTFDARSSPATEIDPRWNHIELGLRGHITHAAYGGPGHKRALRAQLLAACGLAPDPK